MAGLVPTLVLDVLWERPSRMVTIDHQKAYCRRDILFEEQLCRVVGYCPFATRIFYSPLHSWSSTSMTFNPPPPLWLMSISSNLSKHWIM